MHISEVLSQDEYEAQNIVPDFSFDCLETDAAHITPTSLFFLLPGVFRDTDVLLPFVLSKKPACVVTEREIEDSHGVPILKVKNARRAFAFAAYRFYHADNLTFPLIGITGTNGKTTVATEIARLLEAGGKKVGVIGTGCMKIGNKPLTDPYYGMTTPDPPLLYSGLSVMQKEGCDAVIIEVSSHALALEKVSPLCFSIGVFLGLTEEHLDFHVDMENYYQAKKKLFSQTKKAFINVDNAYGKRLYQEIYCEKKSVGIYNNSDIKPTNIRHLGLLGSSFLYQDGEVIFPLSTPLPGNCQITDTLFSCAVSLSIHIPVETIKSGMKSMLPVPGRMEKVSDSPIVYLDYAHTPNSLEFALNTLFSNKMTGQKIILVFGCGGERDRKKRPMMAAVAEKYADYMYITSDNSRGENPLQIFKDIESGCQKKNHKSVYARERAIYMAIENADDEDIVLIEGKGDEPYIKDRSGIRPYSDRKVIEKAVNDRTEGRKILHEDPT